MSLSRDPDFLSLQLFHSNQKNWGLVLREPQYLAAIYNRALFAKDISIFNPDGAGGLFSPLPLLFVEFIARFPACGVLRLVLRLVQLGVASAPLAPVSGGFSTAAGLLRRAGTGPSTVGEGLWWFAGGLLWIPAVQVGGGGKHMRTLPVCAEIAESTQLVLGICKFLVFYCWVKQNIIKMFNLMH